MRDFQAALPGRLRVLTTGSKLLYTAFAIAALGGLFVSWKLYGAAVGEAGPAAYYAGAPVAAPSSKPQAGGPAIDLPDEDRKPTPIVMQMPERKLLEVTHFHLFTIPVYVLILAHLWLLAKIPVWLQHTGVVAAVLTSALHIAAPWLTRGSPGAAAILMPVSGVAMLLTLGGMAVTAAVDMWLPQPTPPPPGAALAELRRRQAARGSQPPSEGPTAA